MHSASELAVVESLVPNATSALGFMASDSGGRCIDQMAVQKRYIERLPKKAAQSRQIRMHNLSAACALVAAIILIACLLLFWIGLAVPIVPPVLVASVLYTLAAVFGIFALTIARHRRKAVAIEDGDNNNDEDLKTNLIATHNDPLLDAKISDVFLPATRFDASWASEFIYKSISFVFILKTLFHL